MDSLHGHACVRFGRSSVQLGGKESDKSIAKQKTMTEEAFGKEPRISAKIKREDTYTASLKLSPVKVELSAQNRKTAVSSHV